MSRQAATLGIFLPWETVGSDALKIGMGVAPCPKFGSAVERMALSDSPTSAVSSSGSFLSCNHEIRTEQAKPYNIAGRPERPGQELGTRTFR